MMNNYGNLQGSSFNLQGSGPALQGSSPTIQGTQPPAQIAPTRRRMTYGNPSATSPKTQFINQAAQQTTQPMDLSGQYGVSNVNGNQTIFNKTTGTAFKTPEEYFADSGQKDFSAKLDANYQPNTAPTNSTTSESAKPASADQAYKDAVTNYINSLGTDPSVTSAKQKYNDFIANSNLGINKLEGQGRGIPLELVRGQQAKLQQQSQIEAQRLQGDIGIATEAQSGLQNQSKARVDYEKGLLDSSKPTEVSPGSALVKFNPQTGQYETVASVANKTTLPASAQEYEYAKAQGFKGSYDEYQNQDANRKRPVTNVSVNGGSGLTPYQTFQAINSLQDNAKQDPDVSTFSQIRGAYEQGKQAAVQKNSLGDIVLMRTIAKITDPTSSVREEEFKTFQGAAGTLPRYGVMLTSNMIGKGQLTQAGRDAIMRQIETIYKQREGAYTSKINFYNQQAQKFGGSIPSYTAPTSTSGSTFDANSARTKYNY